MTPQITSVNLTNDDMNGIKMQLTETHDTKSALKNRGWSSTLCLILNLASSASTIPLTLSSSYAYDVSSCRR